MTIQLSANLGFLWTDRPLCDRVDAAARAGFRAVELHWPYDVAAEDVGRAAREAGVEVLALNSPRGDVEAGEFGLACLSGHEERFRESMRQALDYGRAIEARSIHVMAGKPGQAATADWRPVLADSLAWACDAASDFTILMEPLNRYDNPGYSYATVDEASAVLLLVDRVNARLMLDAYHETREGLNPALTFVRHQATIGHVQIAGVPNRDEPDVRSMMMKDLFSTLSSHGYEGWVGCEYRPATDTDRGLGWIQALEEQHGEFSACGKASA